MNQNKIFKIKYTQNIFLKKIVLKKGFQNMWSKS